MFTVTYNDGHSMTTEIEVGTLAEISVLAKSIGARIWTERNESYGFPSGQLDNAIFIEYEGSEA